jgi:tetratricopeptide (TPR) repeat protein
MEKYWIYCRSTFLFFISFAVISCGREEKETGVDIAKSNYYYEEVMTGQFQQGSDIEQKYLDSAIIYNPSNADAYYEKSAWQIKTGNYVEYFKYMDKAVELKPEIYLGWRGAVKLHYLRDYEGAIEDISAYNDLFPKSNETSARGESTDYLLGLSYMGLENYDKAIYYFNKSIATAKSKDLMGYIDPYTFLYKAVSHMNLQEYRQADLELERTLTYFVNCAEAYYYKAFLALENENQQLACKNMKKALFNFDQGYYLNDPYREVHNQLYRVNIENFIRNNNCD